MTWVRLDDQFCQHPKVVKTGPLGIAMQVAGLCYCNRFLTDGFIPTSAITTFMDFAELDEHAFNGTGGVCWLAVQKLLDAGIWEAVEGGYRIHDYFDYQPSKAEVLEEHRVKQAAGQAGGLARARQMLEQMPKQNPSRRSSKTLAKLKPVPVPVPVPQDTTPLIPLKGESPVTEKKTPKTPFISPPWFEPLSSLEGYRKRNHTRTVQVLKMACATAKIDPAILVRAFAAYWPEGQVAHGWLDPVSALVRTRNVQIAKLRKGANNEKPTRASGTPEDPFASVRRRLDRRERLGLPPGGGEPPFDSDEALHGVPPMQRAEQTVALPERPAVCDQG